MVSLRFSFATAAFAAIVATPLTAAEPEKFLLAEPSGPAQTWLVQTDVTGEGTFEFQPSSAGEKSVVHPVNLTATFRYAERRLPAAGRDEAAYRALRHYNAAQSDINVGGQRSSPRLRNERRRLVIRIERGVISPYCLDGPLTSKEVELLPSLGDSLLLAALLPGREIAVGETWIPNPWVAPALAGAEVALNSNLTARLESVRDGEAIVSFKGEIEGAAKGAPSKTVLTGTLRYQIDNQAIVQAELSQTEKRSIGPLTPGMNLTLKASMRRTPAPPDAIITDAVASTISDAPPPTALQLEYDTPFGVSLTCDRDWQPFHQTDRLLILRLLDSGGLIAQCNVAPAPTVKPGTQTPERQFQEDIARTLGEQLTNLSAAEPIEMTNGHSVYRVTATGSTAGSERIWLYYLVTHRDGQQAALVFTAEPDGLRRLAGRDLDLVKSLSFKAVPSKPVSKK